MLIDKDKACLIISCMQRDFIPTLINGQKLIDYCCWLIDLATSFNVPIIIVNHKNLGQPLESFLKFPGQVLTTESTTFSCLEDNETRNTITSTGRSQFLLAGAESHISIFQSAFSFIEKKQDCFTIVDGISARNIIDNEIALNRLNQIKAPLVTREMIFFEFIRNSQYPNYIDLSLKFLDQRYIRD